MAKVDTIRVLFSIAANKEWPLYQFDVKNAFLHGEIEEEVYMKPSPGYSDEYNQGEGCKLKKALYGLKQSPRAWFWKIHYSNDRIWIKIEQLRPHSISQEEWKLNYMSRYLC